MVLVIHQTKLFGHLGDYFPYLFITIIPVLVCFSNGKHVFLVRISRNPGEIAEFLGFFTRIMLVNIPMKLTFFWTPYQTFVAGSPGPVNHNLLLQSWILRKKRVRFHHETQIFTHFCMVNLW